MNRLFFLVHTLFLHPRPITPPFLQFFAPWIWHKARFQNRNEAAPTGLMYLGLVFVAMLGMTSRAWFPVFKEVKSQLYTLVL